MTRDGYPSAPVEKTLFAWSGNVCAFRDPESLAACEEHLTDPKWLKVKARICHIRGRAPGSARYDATMTNDERGSFENLILMCPTHHVMVDDLEPDRFTVEVLTQMKYKAIEANGAVEVSTWATEDQLDRFAQILSIAMHAIYVGEDSVVPPDVAGNAPSIAESSSGATNHISAGHSGPELVSGGHLELSGGPAPNLQPAGGHMELRGGTGGDVRAAGGHIELIGSAGEPSPMPDAAISLSEGTHRNLTSQRLNVGSTSRPQVARALSLTVGKIVGYNIGDAWMLNDEGVFEFKLAAPLSGDAPDILNQLARDRGVALRFVFGEVSWEMKP